MHDHEKRIWEAPSNLRVGDSLLYSIKDKDNSKHEFTRKMKITQKLEDRFVAETDRGNKYYIGTWNQSDFMLQNKQQQ